MAEIVEASCECPDKEIVERAVSIVRRGGVVVAPTDTLYGIIADPFNPRAVDKVFRLKRRSRGKPLPILLGESHHALLLVRPGRLFWRLALRFWPGPLTIVEDPAPALPEHLAGWGPMGVRLPSCPLTREIARRAGGVLVGTSANISGRESPVTVYESYSQLGDAVDLYIDAGPTRRARPSTVASIVGGRVEILREGVIGREEILRALEGLLDEEG